jgi:uncharacterized protein
MFKIRPKSRIWIGFVGFFIAAFLALNCLAQGVLPVPTLTARVIDQTATLTADELSALSAQLQKLEAERGAQVVVLMVASTQPEDIFSYSNRVANTWNIGRKDVGDGVLIVVAKNDRKLRIEIAKSLEGAIPDVLAGQIISEFITPSFKQGLYASGLQAGVAQIAARIAGEFPTERNDVDNGAQSGAQIAGITAELPSIPVLLLIIFLVLMAFKFLGLSNTLILLSSLSRGSSNSGYSSGGGFSSGGGGNFGGGGASGDW